MLGRVVILSAVVLTACGKRASSLEDEIRRELSSQLEVKVDAVTCSGGPPATACQAKVGDQWLTVSLVPAQEGGRAWSLDGIVVAAEPLERYVANELEDLGVAARPDCGARVRTVAVGDRIACSLGAAGTAWATVEDDAGTVDIEIALGGDAVRARSEDVDPAALDELSAALDLDPGTDEAAADAGVPVDAP